MTNQFVETETIDNKEKKLLKVIVRASLPSGEIVDMCSHTTTDPDNMPEHLEFVKIWRADTP